MKFPRILLSLVLLAATSLSAASRPNVVFLLADDLGYRDRLQSDFNRRDTNKDGKLTLEELKNK
jgi:hypothetical protein